jgi:hypothetical protein
VEPEIEPISASASPPQIDDDLSAVKEAHGCADLNPNAKVLKADHRP